MGPRSTVRAFLALVPDAFARTRLLEQMPGLLEACPGLRGVRPDGIHLTLRFLGETPLATLEGLGPFLETAAERCPEIRASFGGLGVLPRGRPRILFLGIDLPEPACALQRACEEAARSVGLPPEDRAFRPHLTLGRFVRPPRRPTLPAMDWGSTAFSELVLFESRLGPGGSLYTPLRVFPLGRR
jgi:2'-5' RNA ligase